MRMPYNPEFGRRFTRLCHENALLTEEAAYRFIGGAISKATIRNWKAGMPAPGCGEHELARLREVIGYFPDEKPQEWVDFVCEYSRPVRRRRRTRTRVTA